jgi:hypothetical protein
MALKTVCMSSTWIEYGCGYGNAKEVGVGNDVDTAGAVGGSVAFLSPLIVADFSWGVDASACRA